MGEVLSRKTAQPWEARIRARILPSQSFRPKSLQMDAIADDLVSQCSGERSDAGSVAMEAEVSGRAPIVGVNE